MRVNDSFVRLTSLVVLVSLVVFWLITTVPVGVSARLERAEAAAIARSAEPNTDPPSSVRSYDFIHYYRAGEAVRSGENIYASWNGGYIYPPLLAWSLSALVPLGLDAAAFVWYALMVAGIALPAWFALCAFRRAWGLGICRADWPIPLAITGVVFNDQFKATLYLGQTDALLLLGFALPLLSVRPTRQGDRPSGPHLPPAVLHAALAGFGLALAGHVKFLAIGLLPYYAITRQWRIVAWSVAFLIVLGLLPALTLGWSTNAADLRIAFARLLSVVGLPAPSFGMFDPHPIEWNRSRSILSGLARVGKSLGNMELIAAIGGTIVVAAWAIGAAMIYRRHGLSLVGRVLRPGALPPAIGARVLILEWCTMIAGLLALGPQTTKRHALILLPALLLAAMIALRGRSPNARRSCALGLALLFVANLVPISKAFSFEGLGAAWSTLGTLGALGWAIAVFSLLLLDAGLAEARMMPEVPPSADALPT